MKSEIKFGYTVLRYMHDITTQEFINVGVLFYAPENHHLKLRIAQDLRRIHALFPTAEPKKISKLLKHVQDAFDVYANHLTESVSKKSIPQEVIKVASNILPRDSSALQWSPAGGGYTSDLTLSSQKVFSRYIEHHSPLERRERSKGRSRILKPFKQELSSLGVWDRLKPRTVKGILEKYEFPYAWKNNIYHCYEAVNLDLRTSAQIEARALEWIGRAVDLDSSTEKHKLYLLLGGAQVNQSRNAYKDACRALKTLLPTSTQAIEQNDIIDFSRDVAQKIKKHLPKTTS